MIDTAFALHASDRSKPHQNGCEQMPSLVGGKVRIGVPPAHGRHPVLDQSDTQQAAA
nr:hypothetical protein [Paracoccus saliphilus]